MQFCIVIHIINGAFVLFCLTFGRVSVGKTSGAFTSLARALQNPDGADAATWAAQREETSKELKTGATVGGAGSVSGAVGNLIINKYDLNKSSQKDK